MKKENKPKNIEKKVFCPTCGDVTGGHPTEDKTRADILKHGFTTAYTTNGAWMVEQEEVLSILKEKR